MTSGNQSELARKLGVTRAVVNEWVRDGRRYIPAIAAYRLQRAFPGEAF